MTDDDKPALNSMTHSQIRLPADLRHIDEDEQALANMPLLSDRMAYHTKRLRIIRYAAGFEGVEDYKKRHADAKVIHTTAITLAFQPKPKGYDDFICGIVDQWFISNAALAETNRADVERLNLKVHPRRFNPDNHFTKPLSTILLAKLADVFANHEARLDISNINSMSKVRSAVKANMGKRLAGQSSSSIGDLVEDELIVGVHPFLTEKHHGHDCIRVSLGGKRIRLRLDALTEFINLAGLKATTSLYPSIEDRIGELAPDHGSTPEADPLLDILPEIWPRPEVLLEDWPLPDVISLGELAPAAPEHLSLKERMTRLRASQAQDLVEYPVGVDPLTTAPIDTISLG